MFPIAANRSDEENTTSYSDDVFSTTLYTGNGSTQTITNGIDLAGKGGMVWIKSRSNVTGQCFTDTVRGVSSVVISNSSTNQYTIPSGSNITSFNSNGFSLGPDYVPENTSGYTFASWTFRKAAKFFDVVTWIGNGTNQLISHSLGVLPGIIIYKKTNTTSDWFVVQRYSDGTYGGSKLNTTAAAVFSNYSPSALGLTTTTFDPVLSWGNDAGAQYVAYLFAHDTSSNGVIQCGSFTTDGSGNATVNLGWEPQYLFWKSTATGNWTVADIMRGNPVGGVNAALHPNLSDAEATEGGIYPTATGFATGGNLAASQTHIYMAIRRPNKPPTSGTQVFSPVASTSTFPSYKTDFPVDMAIRISDKDIVHTNYVFDRLRGNNNYLETNTTAAAVQNGTLWVFDYNTGWAQDTSDTAKITWNFKRAPGFFDVVCYTGTGSATTQAHNLTVVPEMMIVKKRSSAVSSDWDVYHIGITTLSYPNPATNWIYLNRTDARLVGGSGAWNNTQPTASVFSLGDTTYTNASGEKFVAYLFATLAGISKVGSYTGNGSSQTINCGFAAGARFILIKRTDAAGDWYVWDTARGIVTGNDPHLSLNSTAAEVTTDDSIDPYSPGFTVNQLAATNINVTSATYIFLAIA